MPPRRAFVLGFLLLAAGGALTWTLRGFLPEPGAGAASEPDGEEGAAVDPSAMAVRVTTGTAVLGDLPEVLQVVGQVRADPAALQTLSSRAGGRVVAVAAAVGQDVKAGDVLLRLDPVPLEAAATEAHARAGQARSALAEFDRTERAQRLRELRAAAEGTATESGLAEATVTRLQELERDGLAASKVLAEAQAVADRARRDAELARLALQAYERTGAGAARANLVAARDAADAALREAEAVLAGATLSAPADGQILSLALHEGDSAAPGAPLGTLLLAHGRLLDFGVSVRDVARVDPGAEAVFADPAGERRRGIVARVLGAVDETSGLVQVVVVPEDAEPPLRPGLVVRGEIRVGTLDQVVIVPERAVVRSADAQVVVVVGANRLAHIVPVTLLGRAGDRAAVRGELHAGDRVVVDGGYNLPDGAHVVVGGDRE